ncbi:MULTISPECIES: GspH/FimT family pseudopilin [unclassified Pseudomonas]|uniref:GspH/FimT family pseudopilin n=1 Tax=unclassified Pseudomonas TaxID=196821 RepID=UPI0006D3B364|nr:MULTISPECIES: GspH/FimT family pseudopilin [unclassified Pseudomonas]
MRQQGVTLIQMMSVLAMVALLTQLAAPAYANLTEDLRQAAAARDLAQSLRSARGDALLQNRSVVVQPLEGDWGKGWQTVLEGNQQLLRDNGAFSGGTLQICQRAQGSSQHRVVVAPSGRVSLRSGASEAPRCAGP